MQPYRDLGWGQLHQDSRWDSKICFGKCLYHPLQGNWEISGDFDLEEYFNSRLKRLFQTKGFTWKSPSDSPTLFRYESHLLLTDALKARLILKFCEKWENPFSSPSDRRSSRITSSVIMSIVGKSIRQDRPLSIKRVIRPLTKVNFDLVEVHV